MLGPYVVYIDESTGLAHLCPAPVRGGGKGSKGDPGAVGPAGPAGPSGAQGLPGPALGLGYATSGVESTIDTVAPAAYLTVAFNLPEAGDVELIFTGCAGVYDPINPDGPAVAYWLEVDASQVTGTFRRLATGARDFVAAALTTHGVHVGLAAGPHTATLTAQGTVGGPGATLQWLDERALTVRRWL